MTYIFNVHPKIKMPITMEAWQAELKNFQSRLPNDHVFDRMQGYGDDYAEMDYEAFVNWNIHCFVRLRTAERVWLTELCNRLKTEAINTMDMESAVSMRASYAFFNKDKKLTIACPR